MKILPMRALINVFKRTATQIGVDQVGDLAAALTYYAVFSIFPLLLLLVTLASFIFNADEAKQTVFSKLAGVAPGDTAKVLSDAVGAALEKKGGGELTLSTAVGIISLLFSSSGVFTTLDKAINRAWGCEYKASLIKDKLISFAMVIAVAVMLVLSTFISAVVNFVLSSSELVVGAVIGGKNPMVAWFIQLLSILISIALDAGILVIIFRTLPRCRVTVGDVWLGALLTAVGWEVLKQGFAFYVANFAGSSIYGSIGAIFTLLTWIYLTGFLLLIGAEFTSEYARERGMVKRVTGKDVGGEPVTEPVPPARRPGSGAGATPNAARHET
jgi:membrane protein